MGNIPVHPGEGELGRREGKCTKPSARKSNSNPSPQSPQSGIIYDIRCSVNNKLYEKVVFASLSKSGDCSPIQDFIPLNEDKSKKLRRAFPSLSWLG